ncbi:MAG: M3 family oligoendopeptidase, partial [Candidatus Kapaibacterium sp.]
YKYYQDRPESLTVEFVIDEYTTLLNLVQEANSSELPTNWLNLFEKWNALDCYITGEINRIHYALAKDMNNLELEIADKYFREQIIPVSSKFNFQLINYLLDTNHKEAIGIKYGKRILSVLENTIDSLNPINIELNVKIGELSTKHAKLLSSQRITIQGKEYSLAQASNFRQSPDASLREELYTQQCICYKNLKDECSQIFDELVKLRTQMALNLGYESFLQLGYKNMERTDYGVKEVREFRDNILKFIVPLKSQLQLNQIKELGTDKLNPYDVSFVPSLSLPNNVIPIDEQLEKTQNLFDKLSPRLSNIFKSMVDDKLIDLENRPGKRQGGFCTSIPDEGRVAIFLNSTGNSDDVRVIVHEMGHAFQSFESQKRIESIMLQWPSYDAAEICSMGMEFISMPLMESYFSKENAIKYRKEHLRNAIFLFTTMAIGDEFQEWVYLNPNVSINDREDKYKEIIKKYSPVVESSDFTKYFWYGNGHIFQMPFYYIDYAVAQIGALQLGILNESNPDDTLKRYINLCEIGGTKSVLEIFNSAGLRSPFEENILKDLVSYSSEKLN